MILAIFKFVSDSTHLPQISVLHMINAQILMYNCGFRISFGSWFTYKFDNQSVQPNNTTDKRKSL